MRGATTNPFDSPIEQSGPSVAPTNTEPMSVGRAMGDALLGALLGVPLALASLGLTTGILGGIFRAAPCHSAPDFATGAVFGAIVGYFFLGIPAILVGLIAGGVWGVSRQRWGRKTPRQAE